MRLVDADELKKKYQRFCRMYGLKPLWKFIDNAPTVEPCYQTTSCLDCKMYDKEKHNCPRFCEVIRSAIEERPQGEWNYIQAGMCVCPFCGAMPHKEYKNFCAKCGADMRGKEE